MSGHRRSAGSLPVVVTTDRGDPWYDVVECGQLVFADQQAIELGTNERPFTLDLPHPGKLGIVIDAWVADPGKTPVQPLNPRHDPQQNTYRTRSFGQRVKNLLGMGAIRA